MIQQQLKFLGMLFALSILVSCGSGSSGGGSSAPAPTATLTANPTSFTAGQGQSALTFTSTNANAGSIDNGVGPVGINSHVSVSPTQTTTYTYTATGPGGNATAQATVTVIPVPLPTATLTASPGTITAGQASSTLTFTSTNATSGSIDNGVGPVGINSHVSVSPTQTTTYTYTATGPGGNATAQATVTVIPVPLPTATLSASPGTITAGQGSSTLTFTSTNATSGSIDNGVGPVGINSHVSVTPALTTTYTYTATGPGGSATAQATVTVTPAGPAPTITLAVSPTAIFAGQTITLTWTSANATSVVIDNNVGAVLPVTGGSVTLPAAQSPTQTTTYTATATGDGQQSTASATVTVSPINSADGMLPDSTNDGQQDIDPNGAVGTNQFMEYVNTEYQAFDKTTLAPVPIAGVSGPQLIGIPFSTALNGAATDCAGTGIQLDSVINFDRLANRWVIAAKAVRSVGTSHHYDFCIAVSNTADVTSTNPAFGWYAYEFQLDAILGQDKDGTYYFPDWPKLGTWPDAYYATMDMEDTEGKTFDQEVGVVVCAFDRIDMLAGSAMDPPQCFANTNITLFSDGIYLAHSLIPADFDGTTPPPTGRDEFMVSIQNPSLANGMTATTSNTFNLWDFHLDWTTPGNSTFTLLAPPTVTTYTPGCYLFITGFPALTNCAAEPPYQSVGQTVDSVGDRFMPRLAYRNFGTYESFLVSHTIQTGPGSASGLPNPLQTGVRWYELRANVNGSSSTCDSGAVTLGATPAVCRSGTINPDALLFRFLPSIAQDKDGNAAVGYSFSNSFTNPGIAFSYWDLGTIDASTTEVTIFDGPSEEVTTTPPPGRGQWGSYSSMTVDPADDCTFWYVNEYWPTVSNWATRIANFKLPTCQ